MDNRENTVPMQNPQNALDKSVIDVLKKLNGKKSSALVGCIVVAIKALLYAFQWGKYNYWGIDSNYIEISGDNWLYSVLFDASISVILIIVNFIPYGIVTSKNKRYTKLKSFVTFLLIIWAIVIVVLGIWCAQDLGITLGILTNLETIKTLITGSLEISLLLISFGSIMGIMSIGYDAYDKKKRKKSTSFSSSLDKWINKVPKQVVLMLMLITLLSFYIVFAYWHGYSTATDIKQCKLIKNDIFSCEEVDYLIALVENDNAYVVLPCKDISTENEKKFRIYQNIHLEIEKTDVVVQLVEGYRIVPESELNALNCIS